MISDSLNILYKIFVILIFLFKEVVISASSAAVAELARGNKELQDAIAKENAIVALINIIRLKKLSNQVKAAMAIEALADHNAAIQKEFLDRSTSRHISKLLKARGFNTGYHFGHTFYLKLIM